MADVEVGTTNIDIYGNITLEQLYTNIGNDSILSKDTSQGYPIYTLHSTHYLNIKSGGVLTIGNPNDFSYHEELWFDVDGTYHIRFNVFRGGTFNMYGNTVLNESIDAYTHNLDDWYGNINIIGDDTYKPTIKNSFYHYASNDGDQYYYKAIFKDLIATYGMWFQFQTVGKSPHKIIIDSCIFSGYKSNNKSGYFVKSGAECNSLEIRNCEIYNFTYGVQGWNNNTIFENNYVHDLNGRAVELSSASEGYTRIAGSNFERCNGASDTSGNNIPIKCYPGDYILHLLNNTIQDVGWALYIAGGEIWMDENNNIQEKYYNPNNLDIPIYLTKQRILSIKDADGNDLTGALVSINNEQYRTYTYEPGLEITEKYAKYNWDTGAWDDYTDTMSVTKEGYTCYTGGITDTIILFETGNETLNKIESIEIYPPEATIKNSKTDITGTSNPLNKIDTITIIDYNQMKVEAQ